MCAKVDERNHHPNPSPFQTQDYENLSGELTWSHQRTTGGDVRWWPRSRESSQQVSGAPSGAFLSPMGYLGACPHPHPPGSSTGLSSPGARPGDPSNPLPAFRSVSSSFSLSRLCLPHPSRALCTRFQETPPSHPLGCLVWNRPGRGKCS